MMTIEKISTIKSAGRYEYQGAIIDVTDVLESGRIICTVTLADGTMFEARNRPSSLKYRIEHKGEQRERTNKVTIPCGHADHSTCHGEHATKVVSSNKRAKQHRKLMMALSDIKDIFPYTSDDIVNLVHTRWLEYSSSERRKEAEAEARKAEIAAKKQAEAEAREQAEAEKLRRAMIESYAKSKKLTLEVAEANLAALGII